MSQPQHNDHAARAARARSLTQMIFFGAFILGMMFALPTMLVLTLGLLPMLVAFVVDMNPRRYAARSVGFLNFAGTLPFLISLWTGKHDLISAMKILTDVYAWLVIYSAAAMGWLIYLGMPSVAGFLMQFHATQKIRHLEQARKKLINEWGEAVDRNRAPPPQRP
jgi:1,4-dihydroxy-2-naphthoate octaprenyltransferase